MRTTTAYFAGAGTIVIAIAAGLGGGLVIADMVAPHSPKGAEMSKFERRISEPIPVSNAPSEPVPYLAATQAAANNPVVVSPAPTPSPAGPANAAPDPTTQGAAQPADVQSARNSNSSAQPVSSSQAPSQPTPSAAREPSASSDDAFAKARDVDLKREARRAEDKRKAERRQQWVERRRYRGRQDDELRDVEQKVRQETETPRIFAAEPVKIETPRIRLFGDED